MLFKPGEKKLNQEGFTLMEVMIAITVLAFITMAIITIQGNSRETKERVVAEDQNVLQVETAFARFDWDFTQIYSPLYFSHQMKMDEFAPAYEKAYFEKISAKYLNNEKFSQVSFDGLPIPTFKYPDKSSIVFFTTSNRRKVKDIKQSNFAWVRYGLEKDSNATDPAAAGNIWVRYLAPGDPFNPEEIDWEQVKGQVLLRNVEKILFEYWSHERKKWFDNIAMIKDGKHIIHGIKVTLEWVDMNGFKETFVRVFRPNFLPFTPEDMYELQRPEQPGMGGNLPAVGGEDDFEGEE